MLVFIGRINKLPPELLTLKDSWTRARKQVTDPVDRKFADALSAMKQRFTKAGNLEGALAVDAELKAIAAQLSEDASTEKSSLNPKSKAGQKEFAEYLLTNSWIYGNPEPTAGGSEAVFTDDGKVTLQDGRGTQLPWEISKNGTLLIGGKETSGTTGDSILVFPGLGPGGTDRSFKLRKQ